jgi:pantothenate kinase
LAAIYSANSSTPARITTAINIRVLKIIWQEKKSGKVVPKFGFVWGVDHLDSLGAIGSKGALQRFYVSEDEHRPI